ncbi:MAG TPA: pyrrolo-quinoline quinone [Alphaproteobacteria bacterium]|nr:pyrrolo-quinoline quinone [Alphaproteobacteria bacterium]
MIFRGFVWASVLLLSACASDADAPLAGKKISVLAYGRAPISDSELKKSILLPVPENVEDWAQAGGMAHHAMQNPALSPKIIRAWSVDIGKGAGKRHALIAEPVGQKGIVYTVDAAGLVRAFAASNGKIIWEKNLLSDKSVRRLSVVGSGLGLDNGLLFAALGTGEIVAVDAYNGKEIWRTVLKSPVRSAPAIYGGRLFVVTADNKLTALAQDDGRVLWQHYAFLESVSLLGKASPALDKGIGVAVFASGEIVAFRPENGSLLWTETLGATRMNEVSSKINDIRARPVIVDDKVFVVASGGLLSALDLKSGAVLWEREIAGVNQPWVAGDVLYIVSSDAELIALDVSSGRVLWVNQLARWKNPDKKKDRLLWTGPVLAGNRLLLTNSDGKVVAVAPQTGTIIGWDDLGDSESLAPIVMNGTLFFLTQDGKLVAYR